LKLTWAIVVATAATALAFIIMRDNDPVRWFTAGIMIPIGAIIALAPFVPFPPGSKNSRKQ